MSKINGIILAGSSNEGSLKECSDEPFEALVEINNRPMVSYVFEALKKSLAIKKIVIAGPIEPMKKIFEDEEEVYFTPPGQTPIDSLIQALEVLNTKEKVLIATCDIPLLTEDGVIDFINKCALQEADVYYPVITKEANEAKYPGFTRTYIRFKEGVFTGGNLFVVNPLAVAKAAPQARIFVQNRKSPVALARLVGWKFLLKFFLRLITLSETEEMASRVFDLKGKVIITSFPEVGIDVDKPSDLAMVQQIIEKRA